MLFAVWAFDGEEFGGDDGSAVHAFEAIEVIDGS
jgi:hypothetical protein